MPEKKMAEVTMTQNASNFAQNSFLDLEILPKEGLTAFLDVKQINTVQEINAAVVNVSGRQRMLSQRTALFALRLVCAQTLEREQLRSRLLADLDLMEKSHIGLIQGNPDMKLPGQPSAVVKAMYFESPLNLDQKICQYIAEARALAHSAEEELTQENLHLRWIITAASKELVEALDAIVSQYQKESDTEQAAINLHQAELYHQSCSATAAAQAQAQQLKQALQELREAQDQLIQSEKMSNLGQLVAGVAHEINNPVTFICGNLNYAISYVKDLFDIVHLYQEQYPHPSLLLQEKIETIDLDFIKEDLPKVLSSMEMGAERIRKLVLSLRNFSRTDEELLQRMNIHEGIDNTLLILQNRLKSHSNYAGIQVIKDYGDLPSVQCYPGQMNQVFMNLLGNAIDALEDQINSEQSAIQKPIIRICTEVSCEETITVRISDNGPGIPENIRAKLFEPFFTTKPVGKGTGLGLSISYQIVVEKHQGSLKYVSEPGQGTEFYIEIPVEQSQVELTECKLKTLNVS